MKKLLSAVFVLSLCFFITGCNTEKKPKTLMESILKNNTIKVGVRSDAKPFGYKDENGELKGFDIDLAEEITRNLLGDKGIVEFVEVTPSNRMLTLTSGKADMIIATMSVTDQRRTVVDFSIPYHIAGQALMIHKESDIQGITDLKDKKVIVVLGTTGERSIKRFAPNAIIQGYKTNIDAFNALKEGFGDAMTTDDTILAGFAIDYPEFKILAKRYTKEPYAVAFRLEEESESLKSSVNHIIEHLREDGTLNKIRNKWLDY